MKHLTAEEIHDWLHKNADKEIAEAGFSVDDIQDVAALSHVAAEIKGYTYFVAAIFQLRDGRGAMVTATHSLPDGQEPRAWVSVAPSVNAIWMRPLGNMGISLGGEFCKWHALRCAKKLIALLEQDDRLGWSQYELLHEDPASTSIGLALDCAVEMARHYDSIIKDDRDVYLVCGNMPIQVSTRRLVLDDGSALSRRELNRQQPWHLRTLARVSR